MSRLRALERQFCFLLLRLETFPSPKSTSGTSPRLSGSPQRKSLSLYFRYLDFASGLRKPQRKRENKERHPSHITQPRAAHHVSSQGNVWLTPSALGFTALAGGRTQVSETLSLCTLLGTMRRNHLDFTGPARPTRHGVLRPNELLLFPEKPGVKDNPKKQRTH